jgi:hypothetical protein
MSQRGRGEYGSEVGFRIDRRPTKNDYSVVIFVTIVLLFFLAVTATAIWFPEQNNVVETETRGVFEN